jgi:hypothetical protein
VDTFDFERVRATEDVIYQTVRDEAVLLNLKSQQYYGLDRVGSRMWTLLVEQGDLLTVARTLEPEYDVGNEKLRQDLNTFVGELIGAGLLESVD